MPYEYASISLVVIEASIGGGNRGAMAQLKFEASPWDCNFSNKNHFSLAKCPPLTFSSFLHQWKPLCGYYRRGFYCMTTIDNLRYRTYMQELVILKEAAILSPVSHGTELMGAVFKEL